jgi:hypothetical protein
LLHWYALSRKPAAIAKYRRKSLYWITTLGMIALGGVMPLLYIQGSASALLCFHLGAATPIVVQKLVAAVPAGISHQGRAIPRFKISSGGDAWNRWAGQFRAAPWAIRRRGWI